jgi:hypothetical protein
LLSVSLCIRLCIPLKFLRLMRSPCCLCIPLIFVRRLMRSPCCLCIPLIFVRRLMRSPCCLCIPLIFVTRLMRSPCCLCIPLIFVTRLMRAPYCPCVYVSLCNFFFFYALRVITKESRRKVLSRTSCFLLRFSYSNVYVMRLVKSTSCEAR